MRFLCIRKWTICPKIQAISVLEKDNRSLCNAIDADVVLSVSNNKLGLHLTQYCIDRSHRRGRGAGRGRGVTVLTATLMTQLVSHARLLSSRPTTRRLGKLSLPNAERLQADHCGTFDEKKSRATDKARALDFVTAVWTIDGRIVSS